MKPATTVSKVCRILAEFRARPSMGVTELARRVDLVPSDVHRLLNSLALFGFIEQNPANKTYRLGLGLMTLGLTALQRNELREAARPLLQRLSSALEATAHLAIFDPRERELILAERIDFAPSPTLKFHCGAAPDLHCTALGKSVLAHLPPPARELLLDRSRLPRLTAHTITHRPQLDRELARTLAHGYSVDREETSPGACCLGAPIHDAHGAVAGAISVSMEAGRFYGQAESRLAAAVQTTAAGLATALGRLG